MLMTESRMKGWGVCYMHNSNVKYMCLEWMMQRVISVIRWLEPWSEVQTHHGLHLILLLGVKLKIKS
jgi:hypothetical protein